MATDKDIDYMSLSDEEILNMDLPLDEDLIDEPEEEVEEEETTEQSVVEEEEDVDTSEDSQNDSDEEDTDEEDDNTSDKVFDESEASDEVLEDKPSTDVNYEEFHKQALAPLKANGKNFDITSIDELRSLASMGINYQSKMVAIKPHRLTAKKLENNNIDEATLDYLIDIHKGNKDAIQKLLKENGIDPLDVDTEEETNYSPTSYKVSDKELELDSVLEDIQSTPTFKETLDTISTKWDDESKKIILENPSIIKVINEQIGNGIFAKITSVIDREKVLGRLSGISDIEAYRQVGDALQKQGALNVTTPSTSSNGTQQSKQQDQKVKSKKKAASSTRSSPRTNTKDDFDPYSLSDEEFEKVFSEKFKDLR